MVSRARCVYLGSCTNGAVCQSGKVAKLAQHDIICSECEQASYDKSMIGAAEWLGYPPAYRNRKVVFLGVDLHIRQSAFGVGYPQVNTLYEAGKDYGGNHSHWMLTNPPLDFICYHELGHAQLMSMYGPLRCSVCYFLLLFSSTKGALAVHCGFLWSSYPYLKIKNRTMRHTVPPIHVQVPRRK